MAYFDWVAFPVDAAERDARLEELASCDVLQILKIDPRDQILETLLYWHPNSVPARAQIDGVFVLSVVLSQLLVSDMVQSGLVFRFAHESLQITTKGLKFASARLAGPDVNSIYRVRERGPSYQPLSDEALIALKSLILRNEPDARFLIEDVYHPVLGRATFD